MKINEKIKTREALAEICKQLRGSGKTIGFTSGAFDLLHAGHVDYLEKAKDLCDVLVVGVNTDKSVQSYKGPDRPYIPEAQRIKVLAALASVDYVFLFDERRNSVNIEVLKPDFYVKAGDYNANTLTSKETVEQYGGEVKLIPLKEVVSTTKIASKIAGSLGVSGEKHIVEENAEHFERTPAKPSPAVFIDRDGTINEEVLYLGDPKKFKLLPNALEGIKKFQEMGYRIIITTNQPGIGMGYYSKEDFYAVNREMLKQFSKEKILVDKIYFCPHSKSEQCDCRKPGQKFVELAKRDLNLDIGKSIFIGDKTSDLETGRIAGMKTIAVKTGFAAEDKEFEITPDYVAEDLLKAAKLILNSERVSS